MFSCGTVYRCSEFKRIASVQIVYKGLCTRTYCTSQTKRVDKNVKFPIIYRLLSFFFFFIYIITRPGAINATDEPLLAPSRARINNNIQ